MIKSKQPLRQQAHGWCATGTLARARPYLLALVAGRVGSHQKLLLISKTPENAGMSSSTAEESGETGCGVCPSGGLVPFQTLITN